MADKFELTQDSPLAPAKEAFDVVPHDINLLATVPKGLYIGTAGNVRLRAMGSNTPVTYKNVPAGGYIGVRAEAVLATGTTAADIIAEA